ncbi:Rrf2 family transcriptional regulator [Candidatus Bipolaricaulota bacterium]|nr:Rrf2 family transcriptional regulator [Candidatus Bipolaricaulota bacterium]
MDWHRSWPSYQHVLNRLSHAGIIRSKRGRQGRFQLALSPERRPLAGVPSFKKPYTGKPSSKRSTWRRNAERERFAND